MAKKSRKIKVYRQSGYDYAPVPAIVLKGLWLKDLGFEIGDCISVKCEDGKLIIAPEDAVEQLFR
jgi:toxic protein SymE